MIEECTSRYARFETHHFCRGQIEKLPFRDSCFDIVLCLGALEYIYDAGAAIREMSRTVKKNGIVIVSMLNKISPYRVWERIVYAFVWNWIKTFMGLSNGIKDKKTCLKPELWMISEKSLSHLMTSGGLDVKDVVYYGFNLLPTPLDSKLAKKSVQLSQKLEVLYRSKLKMIGTGFLMKCVRT
jgi:ubiquinone/menaquinone biosynthesis C-methylase UbiE